MNNYHTDKFGVKKPIRELSIQHLQAIIAWHTKKAKEGLTVRAGGGNTAEDIWYEEDLLVGQDVFDYLKTEKYRTELTRKQRLPPVQVQVPGLEGEYDAEDYEKRNGTKTCV